MLSDPTFTNSVPFKKLGSALQVTDSWFVDLKRAAPGPDPKIELAADGGLQLQWDVPVARARVWQPLDLQTLGANAGLLDLRVTVDLSAGTANIVEWIAILEECDGEARFHAKFKLSTSRMGQKFLIDALATNVRLDADRHYRFCIQFFDAPNHVTLHSVNAQVSPSSDGNAERAKRNFDDSALLVEQLKCTLNFDDHRIDPAAVERDLRTLADRNDRASLLLLMEHVGGITGPVERSHPLRSQVINYYARIMLKMNASETAYVHFKALLGNPLLAAPLSNSEIRAIRKLLARACVRTGRADEALEIQRELLNENPLDWEPYYQLGILHRPGDVHARRLYHNAAETLAKNIPGSILSAIAEAYINEGQPDEGLKRALDRLKLVSASKEKARKDDKELYLTLANAWLAVGETELWQAHLDRYFGLFELDGPDLVAADSRSHILHMREKATDSTRFGPLVTVVMTSFNAAGTIEHAARSVLDQSHANLRLVIVDDVSQDGSRELIERLASEDDRVEPMFNDTNMGTYCSKNRALRKFESDFYTFHDSDDWMHPERLSLHLAATRDEVRFTTSMWVRVDEKGRAVVRSAGGYLHENPASTFFGADVLESVGYFDSVRTGADSEFTWRARHILGNDAVMQIRKPLALGLNREDSLTRSGPAAFDEHRYSPVRVKYWEAWAAWHNSIALRSEPAELFIPYPLDERRFEAPAEILPEWQHSPAA